MLRLTRSVTFIDNTYCIWAIQCLWLRIVVLRPPFAFHPSASSLRHVNCGRKHSRETSTLPLNGLQPSVLYYWWTCCSRWPRFGWKVEGPVYNWPIQSNTWPISDRFLTVTDLWIGCYYVAYFTSFFDCNWPFKSYVCLKSFVCIRNRKLNRIEGFSNSIEFLLRVHFSIT